MSNLRCLHDVSADIIVITGDLVDASVEQMLPAVQPIKNMKSKLGTYFVTGDPLDPLSCYITSVQFVTHSLCCLLQEIMSTFLDMWMIGS